MSKENFSFQRQRYHTADAEVSRRTCDSTAATQLTSRTPPVRYLANPNGDIRRTEFLTDLRPF